jgi:hypothetical protein
MSRKPIIDIVMAIDEIVDERPDIPSEFVRELRRFWVAKEEVFFNRDYSARRHYPWMARYESYDRFQEDYSRSVKGFLEDRRGPALRSRVSYLMQKFRQIMPGDIAIFPIVGDKPQIYLPNNERIALCRSL